MNKVVVVTGSGRGLGYSIVKKHLALQDTVYAYNYRTRDTLTRLTEKNASLHICKCDLSSDSEVSNAMQEILAKEKKVDIVYNVAGIFFLKKRWALPKRTWIAVFSCTTSMRWG